MQKSNTAEAWKLGMQLAVLEGEQTIESTRHNGGNYSRGILYLDDSGRVVRQLWWVDARPIELQQIVLLQTDTTSHTRPHVQLCWTCDLRASTCIRTAQSSLPTN